MIKASGIWENTSKDGKTKFFSGSMGGVRIVIMPNSFKAPGSNEPDYNLYFEENKRKEKEEVAFQPDRNG
jgi:hypothetical protein